MKRLSRDARALIQMARPQEEPGEGERERMRRRLGKHLGYAALATVAIPSTAGAVAAGASGGVAASAATTSLWVKLVLAAGLIGAGAAVSVHAAAPDAKLGEPARAALTSHAAAAGTALVTAAAPHDPERPAPEARPAPPPSRPKAAASASASGAATQSAPSAAPVADLQGELGLLQSAQQEMQAGRSDRALELLNQHEQTHKDGVLREERQAARVVALCGAGRVDEARAAAERFLRESPSSPLAARVRGACPAK